MQIQNEIIAPFMTGIHTQPTANQRDKKNAKNQPLRFDVSSHVDILILLIHRNHTQSHFIQNYFVGNFKNGRKHVV